MRTSLGCWITNLITVKCRACGKLAEPVHVAKVAGEIQYSCDRCCELCRSQPKVEHAAVKA